MVSKINGTAYKNVIVNIVIVTDEIRKLIYWTNLGRP